MLEVLQEPVGSLRWVCFINPVMATHSCCPPHTEWTVHEHRTCSNKNYKTHSDLLHLATRSCYKNNTKAEFEKLDTFILGCTLKKALALIYTSATESPDLSLKVHNCFGFKHLLCEEVFVISVIISEHWKMMFISCRFKLKPRFFMYPWAYCIMSLHTDTLQTWTLEI